MKMTKPKPATRKDGTLTRGKIMRAAAEEFSAKGLAGARVDEIAKSAGANKSLIYQYYGSKDGLFAAVLEQYYEIIRNGDVQADAGAGPVEALTGIISATYDAWLGIPEFVNILASENLLGATHVKKLKKIISRYKTLIETIDDILRQGAQLGHFRAGIDARQLYVTIAALTTYHLSNNHTLSTLLGVDMSSKQILKQRREHVVAVVMGYVRGGAELAVK